MREINNILSVYNLEGQLLRTHELIGYLIADVDQVRLLPFLYLLWYCLSFVSLLFFFLPNNRMPLTKLGSALT
jgi:hypothetical protein